MSDNKDQKTVEGFGDEWGRFDQSRRNEDEHQDLFNLYFSIFAWEKLPDNASGLDMGCDSGHCAKFLGPKVGVLHFNDPSSAREVAKRNLSNKSSCHSHAKGVGDDILPACSQDFLVSLGVLPSCFNFIMLLEIAQFGFVYCGA